MTLKTLIIGGVGAEGPHQGIIGSIIQPAVELMFAAAVVFFLWNIFMAIIKSDQPAEREKFKSKVGWGIIAIAVMASVWGLVALVLGSTGLDTSSTLNIRTGP